MGPVRCQHCAEQLPYEAFFCSRCGRPVEGGGRPIAARHPVGRGFPKPRRRGGPFKFFVIAVGAVMAFTWFMSSASHRPLQTPRRLIPYDAERRIPFRESAEDPTPRKPTFTEPAKKPKFEDD